MEPTDSKWSRRYSVVRAQVMANGLGKTFVVAFNKDKNEAILCCPLEKLLAEHPYGLVEEDVFYRADPGRSMPLEEIA